MATSQDVLGSSLDGWSQPVLGGLTEREQGESTPPTSLYLQPPISCQDSPITEINDKPEQRTHGSDPQGTGQGGKRRRLDLQGQKRLSPPASCSLLGESLGSETFALSLSKSRPNSVHKQVRERGKQNRRKLKSHLWEIQERPEIQGERWAMGGVWVRLDPASLEVTTLPLAALQVTSLTSPPWHFSLNSPVCWKPGIWGSISCVLTLPLVSTFNTSGFLCLWTPFKWFIWLIRSSVTSYCQEDPFSRGSS